MNKTADTNMGGNPLTVALPLYRVGRTSAAKMADASAFESKKTLTLRKAPFSRLCTHIIINVEKNGLRMGSNVRETLLEASEAHLKSICKKAQRLCEHSKRKEVDASDLEFAWHLDNPDTLEDEYTKHKKSPQIAKAVMKRLFKEAGMERISSSCFAKAQQILEKYLLDVLENCNAIVQSRRTQSSKDVKSPTISAADVSFALNQMNEKLYGVTSAKR